VDVDGCRRPVNGAQLAILDGERVVLQLRPWPPGWELPGGHCEPGEDPAVTAAREAEEETGLSVRVTGLVGVYTWEGLRAAGDAVFYGEAIGGRRRPTVEAWAVRSFPVGRLPRTLFPWDRQRVLDAVARSRGARPVHRVQPVTARLVLGFAIQWMRAPLDLLTGRGRRSRRR
jgi:8-oxo-dGTP pyrophosphatase MutT (NUDIX family)